MAKEFEKLPEKEEITLIATGTDRKVKKYIKNYWLCSEAEVELVKRRNTGLFAYYLRNYDLGEKAEAFLVEHSDFDMLKEFIYLYDFTPEAELKLFARADAFEVVYFCIKKGYCFREAGQLKFFDLPKVGALLKSYILLDKELSASVQLKMLDLENAKRLLQIYRYRYDLHPEVFKQAKARKLL